MCDAAEDTAGLPVGAVRLKWPNDLVIETGGPKALLVGDLTPEAARPASPRRSSCASWPASWARRDGLGTDDPRVVVGIGINADWARDDFPPDIAATMTSLREASGGRPIDREALLAAFLDRLEARVEALRAGYFDIADWTGRQATTGPARDPRVRRRLGHRAAARPRRRRGDGRAGRRGRRRPRAASGASTPARSSACGSRPRRGVTEWPDRCLEGRSGRRPPVVVLDRDRALVEAARRDPAQFDALYRKYLAQVYAYALYELADHHAAEDATERDVPARPRRAAALPRAGPPARTAPRRPRSASGCSGSPATSWRTSAAPGAAARPTRLDAALGAGLAIADTTDLEAAGASTRDEAAGALPRAAGPPRRPAPRRGPALRGRDEHRRDRRASWAAVRGRRPRPHPPRAAVPSPASWATTATAAASGATAADDGPDGAA